MGAACDGGQIFHVRLPRKDLPRTDTVEPADIRVRPDDRLDRRMRAESCEHAPCGWRIDHAESGPAVLDQGDVDGKIRVASDERFGPVQRIDQEKRIADFRHLAGSCCLLRDHRDSRSCNRQSRMDNRLRLLVGNRNRRSIALAQYSSAGLEILDFQTACRQHGW